MIEEIKGDVFLAKEDILIHGANCFHKMGAGVARSVKRFYPGAYEADKLTQWGCRKKLGDFSFYSGKHFYYPDQNIIVINLYTQYEYGTDKQNLDYTALKEGLEKVEFVFRGHSFAMPKIGAGLGGGDWATIKKIIEETFTGYKKNELVRIYLWK